MMDSKGIFRIATGSGHGHCFEEWEVAPGVFSLEGMSARKVRIEFFFGDKPISRRVRRIEKCVKMNVEMSDRTHRECWVSPGCIFVFAQELLE